MKVIIVLVLLGSLIVISSILVVIVRMVVSDFRLRRHQYAIARERRTQEAHIHRLSDAIVHAMEQQYGPIDQAWERFLTDRPRERQQ